MPVNDPSAAPLVREAVAAGFPSPAEGEIDRRLDLNAAVIRNPASTFFVRVAGDSMVGAGILRGDLLAVDRALEPRDGNVIIARLDDEYTVKRLVLGRGGRAWLVAENPEYAPREVTGDSGFEVWGVVTCAIRPLAWRF